MASLLTQEEKKILARRDKLTVVLVYVLGLMFLTAVALIFLLPSYFLTQYKLEGVENRLDLLNSSLSLSENEETSVLLNETRSLVSALKESNSSGSMFSQYIAMVSNMAPSGVALNKFEINEDSAEKGKLSMGVSGVASNRARLIEFVEILKKEERFDGANLPIGVFARDNNIEFAIDFTVNTKETANNKQENAN